MRLFQSETEFCTICRDEKEKENFHRIGCNHAFHFECLFQMVFVGKIYQCPNCRHKFTEEWLETYSVFIYNEADKRNMRNAVENTISYLRREIWNQNERARPVPDGHVPMDTPPRLVPPEPFEEDAAGNWVVDLGHEEEINPIDALLDSDMNIRPPTPPEPIQYHYNGPSLIPNRRAHRRQRIQYIFEDRDADDERRNSSQTSSD